MIFLLVAEFSTIESNLKILMHDILTLILCTQSLVQLVLKVVINFSLI